MNTTLVAYYGNKPPALAELLKAIQHQLADRLGSAYATYAPEQVHATIIGLEGRRVGDRVLNANYYELRRESRVMGMSRILDVVAPESGLLPLQLRIGGFSNDAAYPFASRNRHPYLRSFSIQGDVAVAMGWPVDGDHFPLTLDRLRRAFNRSGVLHKYHRRPGDVDNDLFFVVGNVDRTRISEDAVRNTQHEMRRFLSSLEPLRIELGRENIAIVGYEDATLPWGRCRVFPLLEARHRLGELDALHQAVV